MARKTRISALLVLTGALAACGPAGPNAGNMSLNSVNQPVVQRTDFVLDLPTSSEGLAASERAQLNAWFQSMEIGYGDRVFVDEATGGWSDGTAQVAVAEVAGRYGLLVGEGAPVTAGAVPPGTVRVVVSRTTASVPGCPNWQEGGRSMGHSGTSTNFGCATNSNLAAMIADPNDLVRGRIGAAGGDPTTATRAIRSYREQAPTGARGLTATSTTTGGN